jgi:hypothetical protein
MILAENQNLHRQLRLHNNIRQFIANVIGEDLNGFAVRIALSAACFLAIFDFEQELKGFA